MRLCWRLLDILLQPDFSSCHACSADIPFKSVYLTRIYTWEGNSQLGNTFRIGTRNISIYCKNLVRGLKGLLELGTTFCVECHKQWPGCHSQELTSYCISHRVKDTAVVAINWWCWMLWFSSLIVLAHHSQHGLCELTRFLHGDLKAGRTRHKTFISRSRQRDPNYFNTLTHAVIASLNSKHKKADDPEPKCVLPAVWEL